jgi:tetratricopeptide (TPR) repeat protein
LKNDPQNFKAWHILGRWHYELSNLNLLERAAVKVLYGGVPAASIKESIQAFEKARSIVPGLILNYLEMAKAYKQHDQRDKAIAYLKFMLSLPNQTEDDTAIKEMGKKLLKEWK